jgi:hypothetical protein
MDAPRLSLPRGGGASAGANVASAVSPEIAPSRGTTSPLRLRLEPAEGGRGALSARAIPVTVEGEDEDSWPVEDEPPTLRPTPEPRPTAPPPPLFMGKSMPFGGSFLAAPMEDETEELANETEEVAPPRIQPGLGAQPQNAPRGGLLGRMQARSPANPPQPYNAPEPRGGPDTLANLRNALPPASPPGTSPMDTIGDHQRKVAAKERRERVVLAVLALVVVGALTFWVAPRLKTFYETWRVQQGTEPVVPLDAPVVVEPPTEAPPAPPVEAIATPEPPKPVTEVAGPNTQPEAPRTVVVEEEPPPPPPMVTPVQAPAVLRISSDRRGVVYLNGKNVGTVKPGQSLRLDVQTGRQTVRFVPAGGDPSRQTFNVSEGDVFEHKF